MTNTYIVENNLLLEIILNNMSISIFLFIAILMNPDILKQGVKLLVYL